MRKDNENLRKDNDDLRKDNDNLRKEKENLRKEKENLRKDNDDLRKDNDDLKEQYKILEDKITKLQKKKDDLKIKLDEFNLAKNEEIKKVNDKYDVLIKEKLKTIEELRENINKNTGEINKINNLQGNGKLIAINFISGDQCINYSIICNSKQKFYEIENQLYEKYPEYRDDDNYFLINGTKIKRFRNLEENGILGYIILLKKNDAE